MFEDPPQEPRPARPLEEMSVEELEARIAALKEEIAACEAELEKKRSHLSAADRLFGGGGED